nr:MAG TPA: DNA gyrase inhibitor [Caudoviricetes sp.]
MDPCRRDLLRGFLFPSCSTRCSLVRKGFFPVDYL